jgi:hypothetical protein
MRMMISSYAAGRPSVRDFGGFAPFYLFIKLFLSRKHVHDEQYDHRAHQRDQQAPDAELVIGSYTQQLRDEAAQHSAKQAYDDVPASTHAGIVLGDDAGDPADESAEYEPKNNPHDSLPFRMFVMIPYLYDALKGGLYALE